MFAAYGLPLLKSGVAKNADEAAKIVDSFGTPVVMKVMSADVIHKFDAGGVILNVRGGADAKATYQKILDNVQKAVPGAKVDGILIEEMARKGVEVILGTSRDERFGPFDDVRTWRHDGRSVEGRVIPLGSDVADVG